MRGDAPGTLVPFKVIAIVLNAIAANSFCTCVSIKRSSNNHRKHSRDYIY